jgi:hypothetical protein
MLQLDAVRCFHSMAAPERLELQRREVGNREA